MLAALALIAAIPASALGIGEPRHVSPLFEPLRVDIPIEGAADADLRVRLTMVSSSREALVSEVDGRSVTASLHQELVELDNGRRVLRVSTDRIISEPLMTLQVDVSGNGAHIRRELTLLFDPPGAPAVPDTHPVATAAPAPNVEQTPVAAAPAAAAVALAPAVKPEPAAVETAAAAAPPPRRAAPVRSKAKASTPKRKLPAKAAEPADSVARRPATTLPALNTQDWQQYGPVEVGETVMMVAKRVRPSPELSVTAMAALLRWLNPDAFLITTGDLRPGAVLHYPDPTTLTASAAAFGPIEDAAAPSAKPATQLAAKTPAASADAAGAIPSGADAGGVRALAGVQPALATALPIAAAGILTPPSATLAARPLPVAHEVFPAWLVTSMLGLTLLTFGALVQVMRLTPRRTSIAAWLDEEGGDKVIASRTLDLQEPDVDVVVPELAQAQPMSTAEALPDGAETILAEPAMAEESDAPIQPPPATPPPPLVAPDWELLNEPPPQALADLWPDQATLAAMDADTGLALAPDSDWSPDQFDLLLPDIDSDTVPKGQTEPGWQTIKTPAEDHFDLESDLQRVMGQVRRK